MAIAMLHRFTDTAPDARLGSRAAEPIVVCLSDEDEIEALRRAVGAPPPAPDAAQS